MASGMTLTGGDAMKAKLGKFMKRFPSVEAAALYQEAQVEMTESKKRCPVDKGILHGSGHVLKPVAEGRKISVDLVYGGPAEAYAVIVHEDLRGVVPRAGGAGQSRFLASVLEESATSMAQRIAARVQFNEEMLR